MSQTQISDVIAPDQFTAYQVENSLVSTALFQSGVVVKNAAISAQLQAGAEQFSVPFWSDLQVVRKSFLHQSQSEMSLASELARIQSRVQAYWDRQSEKRIIASLRGDSRQQRDQQR